MKKWDGANTHFLSKLIVSSDFDGWYKYLNVKHPSSEDYDFAKKVIIEYSIDGGEWLGSNYFEKQAFIAWVSFAWDDEGPLEVAGGGSIQWRAVVAE